MPDSGVTIAGFAQIALFRLIPPYSTALTASFGSSRSVRLIPHDQPVGHLVVVLPAFCPQIAPSGPFLPVMPDGMGRGHRFDPGQVHQVTPLLADICRHRQVAARVPKGAEIFSGPGAASFQRLLDSPRAFGATPRGCKYQALYGNWNVASIPERP